MVGHYRQLEVAYTRFQHYRVSYSSMNVRPYRFRIVVKGLVTYSNLCDVLANRKMALGDLSVGDVVGPGP